MPSSSASARLRSMASAAGLLLVLSAVLGGAAVLPRKPRCMHSAYLGTVADLEAGKPLGEPLSAAPVGARIVHRWHCDGDGLAAVSFRNCYVSDGETRLADVIDQRGCSMDPLLVSDIRRASDQRTTFMETEVFKYANQSELWYFCEAQTCSPGRCDDYMPDPACYETVDAAKQAQLLVPAHPPAQPAPTPDQDEAELEELMRHSNGTYQPALIVSGRLRVQPARAEKADKAEKSEQPEQVEKSEQPEQAEQQDKADKSAHLHLSRNAAQASPTAAPEPSTPALDLVDSDTMERMTYGKPLTRDGLLVLVLGLATLLLLAVGALVFIFARRYERVLECGKREYPGM